MVQNVVANRFRKYVFFMQYQLLLSVRLYVVINQLHVAQYSDASLYVCKFNVPAEFCAANYEAREMHAFITLARFCTCLSISSVATQYSI